MNILVTYWSQTGNTAKVAGVIFEALPPDKTLKPMDEVTTMEGFDLIFIGFPIMQFGPPAAAKQFIAAHAGGKNIALFVTHAMLSNSDDPKQQVMLKNELDKCMAVCSQANLLGMYHCQGELSAKITGELQNSGIPMLMEFAAMRPATIGHPDFEEMRQAKEFAARIINGLSLQIT
jgi:menaquinone-dependent protoporphyrinogen IX oxidase